MAKLKEWKERKLQERSKADPKSTQAPTKPAPDVPDDKTANSAEPATTVQEDATANSQQLATPVGKFDPKAIAKRARAAMDQSKAALGGDVVIPKSATEKPALNGSKLADKGKDASSGFSNGQLPIFRIFK